MKARISILTLAVDDLERSLHFYQALGWITPGIVGTEYDHGAVAFFDLENNLKLALYPRANLAIDSTLPMTPPSATGFSIGQLVKDRDAVNETLDQAAKAGGIIVKPAQETFYGGYAGYFQDPDGNLWEIAWNPEFDLPE